MTVMDGLIDDCMVKNKAPKKPKSTSCKKKVTISGSETCRDQSIFLMHKEQSDLMNTEGNSRMSCVQSMQNLVTPRGLYSEKHPKR